MGFRKMLLLSAGTYIAIGITKFFLDRRGIHLGTTAILGIYAILSVLVIYVPPRKRPRSSGQSKAVEYIANGQGKPTGRIFDPAQFRGYTEVDSDRTGRTFSDASGKIICTCYVTSRQTTDGASRLHLILLCLLTVLMGMTFEALFRDPQQNLLELCLSHILYRLSYFFQESSWLHVWSNITAMLGTLKQLF